MSTYQPRIVKEALRTEIEGMLKQGCYSRSEIRRQLGCSVEYVQLVEQDLVSDYRNLKSAIRCPHCGQRVKRVLASDMRTCVPCSMN